MGMIDDLFGPRRRHKVEVDPVCGMSIDVTDDTITDTIDGKQYWFCSEDCHQRFKERN